MGTTEFDMFGRLVTAGTMVIRGVASGASCCFFIGCTGAYTAVKERGTMVMIVEPEDPLDEDALRDSQPE